MLVARQTGGHWVVVLLRSSGSGPSTEPPPPAPPTPLAPPATAPPTVPVAPASTGVLSAIGGGSITITRPNGEVVPGLVGSTLVLRCIRVSDGRAVSTEPCSTSHLVVGAQVAASQRTLVEAPGSGRRSR